MKVLLITKGYPGDVMTGVGTYASDLAVALTAAGHTVAHLCTGQRAWRQSCHLRWGTREGRQVAYLMSAPSLSSISPAGLNQETKLLVVEPMLAEALRVIRPDLVHAHDLAGIPSAFIPSARRGGFPVVITLHDFWPFCRKVLNTNTVEICEAADAANRAWGFRALLA